MPPDTSLAVARRRVLIFTVVGVVCAIVAVGIFAKLTQDPAGDLFRRAATLMAEGRQAEAKPLLALIVRDHPNSSHAARARELLGSGPVQPPAGESPAERLFREARNFYPLGSASRNDLVEAVTRYQNVIDSYPADPVVREALYECASALDQLGRYDESIRAWKKFESEFPTDGRAPEALYALGYIHYNQLGDVAMGRAYYDDLMRRYPESNAAEAARVALGISRGDSIVPPPGATPEQPSGRPSITNTPGQL